MSRSADEATTASVLRFQQAPFQGPRMVAVALVVTTSAFGLHFAAGTFVVPLSQERGRASSLVLLAVGHPATLVVGAVLFGASSFPVIPLTVALLSQGHSPAVLGRVLGPASLLHQSAAAAGVLAAAVSRDLVGSHRPVLAADLLTRLAPDLRPSAAGARRGPVTGRPATPLRHHRPSPSHAPGVAMSSRTAQATRYHTVSVDGVDVFYREAGDPTNPTLVLLHGFPTSSAMFRDLITELSDEFHLIAPDHVGFGQSAMPSVDDFDYSFERLTHITLGLLDQLGLQRFALYVQDYGAPIGLRIASRHPERVTALISQSGNAYLEGFTPFWDVLFAHARDRAANEEQVRTLLQAQATRWQYTHGVPADRLDRLDPGTWTLDQALLDRPGNQEIQLQLFWDYQFNLEGYPAFQEYFRTHRPPTLITWGANDEIFGAQGAEAYLRDLPDAELHLLDAGHFALETHGPEIAALVRQFLRRTA